MNYERDPEKIDLKKIEVFKTTARHSLVDWLVAYHLSIPSDGGADLDMMSVYTPNLVRLTSGKTWLSEFGRYYTWVRSVDLAPYLMPRLSHDERVAEACRAIKAYYR